MGFTYRRRSPMIMQNKLRMLRAEPLFWRNLESQTSKYQLFESREAFYALKNNHPWKYAISHPNGWIKVGDLE